MTGKEVKMALNSLVVIVVWVVIALLANTYFRLNLSPDIVIVPVMVLAAITGWAIGQSIRQRKSN